mgnify:CR=1 FL=1
MKYIIVKASNGRLMCVTRPADLSLAAVAANEEAQAAGLPPIDADFDDIVAESGGATFVGFYGRRGMLYAIVDERGNKVGDIQPGDAFAEWIPEAALH